ncbi:MAG: tetratricopeptide repeat protein [Geminicoccaceae bacterium]
MPLRPLPPRLAPHLSSLATVAVVALSLAACAAGSDEGWWSIGFGHAAQAAASPSDGETATGSYLAGRAALDAGDLRGAAQGFEAALAAAPDNLELRRQVFALLLSSGELDSALEAARDLSQRDAAPDEAVLLLGLDATKRGADTEALRLLEGLGRGNIAGPVQPILVAWARYASGARAQAIDELAVADPNSGLDRLRSYHRVAMLDLAGRARDGLDALHGAFPDLAAAPVRVLGTALELQLAAGDRAAADATIDAARKAAPDDRQVQQLAAALAAGKRELSPIRSPADGMGDALLSISEAFFEQERNAEAMVLARSATFVAPRDDETWLTVARISLAQQNPTEALAALDRISASGPTAWAAGLARARALQDLNRPDEAVKLLESMAEQAPERSDALIAMGDLLRGKDRFAEAEAAYTRAVQRLPKIERSDWRLLYARGITYERTKRWPQAEADLLKALELEPDQPFVLNYLGYSWVDQGLNLDRAKGMLHRAVELRPDDGFIVDSLGWAYYRLGEHEKAVTYLERAVELEPGDPVLNDHLGDVYWRVGRQREARFQWQRALVFKPEPDAVAAIQAKLANGLGAQAPSPG